MRWGLMLTSFKLHGVGRQAEQSGLNWVNGNLNLADLDDHSLVIGGTFNGLCTNYQITAESAIRAVVHMEGTPDPRFVDGKVDSLGRSYPPHMVVEQFNVLGPD